MVIPVNLKEHSYAVSIERGILNKVDTYLTMYESGIIVTDSGVPKSHVNVVYEKLNGKFDVVTIPNGEENKNYTSVHKILDFMIEKNLNRKSCVIALGGGVVGDVAGFCASIYMRGCAFVNIPSTFLSMVDSSVGGKTGIDYNGIKNLVGSFYQPKFVLIDPDLLKTLDQRQINSGICESLKMAACFDKELFEKISNGISEEDYEYVISKSIMMKKDVIEKDEKENMLRRVLNFGHTLGHGIEESCDGKLYHGECVGLGMIAITNGETQKRITKALENNNLPTKAYFDKEKALDAISHDKKSTQNGIVCVELDEIGKFSFRNIGIEELKSKLDIVRN